MNTRAYSTFELKSFNEDTGEFEGIASTPTTDRMGDIVEPKGAQFTLPLPLLYQHNSRQPIGLINSAKVTGDKITVKGRVMKELLSIPWIQEAWTLIKSALIRGLSIGFKPLENEPLNPKEPWGPQRFIKWDWLELSAVTIPANAEATITSIKSFDEQQRAALGRPAASNSPGASGRKLNQGAAGMKTIAEQIAGFEATRVALIAKNDEIMAKAGEEGRTLDAAEQEEYDGNAAQCKDLDAHIVRLREHEKLQLSRATPIKPDTSQEEASRARQGTGGGVILMDARSNLPKGTAFVRYAMAIASSRGNLMQAVELAKGWKDSTPEVEIALKAAVAAGTTTAATWAAPLVVAQNMASEFVDLLRPETIIGRLPGVRRVPFNISMARTTAGSSSQWVGEGNPKPISSMAFETITLGFTKIATIVVLTEETVRFSNPAAEAIVSADMRAAIVQYSDQQFIDPTVTASSTVRPASITNGAQTYQMTGATIANIITDVSKMFAYFSTNNIALSGAVFVMHPRTALYLSMLRTTQDIPAFPGMTMTGGTFFGLPVITSNSVPIDTGADTYIALISQENVLVADDGNVTLDISREASLVMDSAPSNPATSTVSLWQSNLVGLRAERFINYRRRRDAGVVVLEDVTY